MAKMTAAAFVAKAIDIAKNYKTLYVMGCFGAPMTDYNKQRYAQNHAYNKQASRTAMIKAASSDTFGFDCVCLIKGILWGWCGKVNASYGGATYVANGVPDIGADGMINVCSGVSTNFSNITPGEALWKSGHIGIYIGDGLAVESTPIWENKVQITAVENIGSKSGYNARTWTKHGKLPYVDYTVLPGMVIGDTDEQTTEDIIRRLVAEAVDAKESEFNKKLQAAEDAAKKVEDELTALKKAIAEAKIGWREQMNAYRSELQDNDAGAWSAAARDWAIANGISNGMGVFGDGTVNYGWGDFTTREQMVTFLHRLVESIGAQIDSYMNDWLQRNTMDLLELRDSADR